VLLGVALGGVVLLVGCGVLLVALVPGETPPGGAGETGERSPREVRSEARRIPYNRLIKDPDRYAGEAVTYRGKIFQVQESGGSGFMLLSTKNAGYGLWEDEVYVNYSESFDAAEGDVVRIYGTVTGAADYETQIGGSNHVPEIEATTVQE